MYCVPFFTAVPPPSVSVQPDTTQVMYAGTARNLTCTVNLTNVDIVVIVYFNWSKGNITFATTDRVSVTASSQSGNQSSFTSSLMFSPLDSSTDSGEYQCEVIVDSDPTDDFITTTGVTDTAIITVQRK